MPMKTIEGYSKEKYTNTSVLLAGGGAKALSDFIGSLSWDSTNKKIKYTPIGGSATDLVTLSWDNIANKPTSLPANGGNADTVDGQHLITQVSDWNTDSLSIFKSSENSISNAPTTDYTYGVTLRFHRDPLTYHTDIVSKLYSDRLFFRRKTESGYGEWRELIHSGNIGSQSVNYAISAGSATYPAGFTSRGTNDWSGVPGTLATDWSVNDADIMFKYDGSKLNVITDGRFYQGIDIYGTSKRVLDEYDIYHTKWGDADTLDDYHIGDLDLRYTRTGWSFCSPSDNSMTGSTDLQDWVTNMYNQGGYKGYSSITVGSWWWIRSLDFSSPAGTIRTSGAMIVYSGDGSSNKNYKHFLVLDASAELYGITSNEESWKYYSRFLNNRNYTDFVYSKSTSDSRYLRKDTNDSTPYQYSFTKTNDHAIQVGTIRGRAVGSQTGEYIHLYERVAIGSPSGWGSRNAPTYGLATYGGAWLATDTGNVTIGGTNQLASAWGSFNLTVGKDTNKVVIGYLNSSTNGVVVGGHNNALSKWAPLNIAGTTLYFRINETIKATIDSNGNFGIGTSSPEAKLEVTGNGKFTNSLSVNTGNNFNFYTDTNLFFVNKSLENWRASSYEYWVYLLIPVITTTNTSAMNFIEGTFNFWKTGGNVYDNVHVNLNCVYNVLEYSLMSYGQGTDWKLVRCTYNGVEYYALQGYYHANPYTHTNFCGHVNSTYRGGNNTTDKPLNLPYGVCYCYAPGGNNQILNSEVYNSISTTLTTSVITAVNRRGLSNPGGFIGPLTGNATTATYASSAGSVAWGNVTGKPFNWSGQSGQPTWLWGSNDGTNYYVWNPSNFSVNYANRAAYLDGHGVNPDNSHPGYGARVFYSWNIGSVGNATSGYSTGITIGSHPSDQGYGFQIVQNLWDDRTYTRRYNGGWQEWKTLAWTSDIPSVGNGTVTVTQAGSTIGSFTMNQSGNTLIALNDTNTNYYPIRSYTSGLQISSYSGSTDCALFVPYATNAIAGAVSTAAQSFAGQKTFLNGIKVGSTRDDQSTDNAKIYFGDNKYVWIGESPQDDALMLNCGTGKNIYFSFAGNNAVTSSNYSTYAKIYMSNSGAVYASSGFYESSDERLKKVVDTIKVNLDDLAKLRKIYYLWNNTPEDGRQLGMIAQDVQKLYPELVSMDKETGYLSLAYDKLSVIALEAIDTLYEEYKQLKERVNKLEKLLYSKEIL